MQKLFSLLLVISIGLTSAAQQSLPIGEWDDYLPYRRGNWVTQSDDKIYYATEFSVLSITKDELTPTFIGKLEGLSDVGIETINYDKVNDQLLIVYTNSNIDIYTDLEVFNIPDIKNNTNIAGSKRIRDIHIYDENSAFLATSFGIVELDLKTLDFGSTIFTDVSVNDVSSQGNKLYAATDDGIFTITITPSTNIADFSRWQKLGGEIGLSDDYAAEWVELSADRIYTVINEELLISIDGQDFEYEQDSTINAQDIAFLAKANGGILVGLETEVSRSKVFKINDDASMKEVGKGCIAFVKYGVEDEEGRVWFAERFANFRYSKPNGEGCETPLSYNTPMDAKVSDIAIVGENIYIATGGVDTENGFKLLDEINFSGVYEYDGKTWTTLNSSSLPAIGENNVFNMFQVEAHPNNGKVMLGSFFEGIIEYDPETMETRYFDQDSSALQGIIGDTERERVSGMAYDDEGVLWVNNFGAPRPLVARAPDDTWYSFGVNSIENIAECVVDNSGIVWSIVTGGSNGVLVYDHGQDLQDPTDDQQRVISSSNSEIEGIVTSLAVDLDGQVWVGTDAGPVIFDAGPGVFDINAVGNRRKVLQDSIVAFLLETEDIRAIAIDGANRKWFGTRNGIFVQSPDGETQIAQFTTENSPLFNDVIKELKFDGNKGIMYIGTDFGVQLIRTATTNATRRHSSNVYAFPNPVRPEYEGEIRITGLARDADVKITDLNGKLVYETVALGGLASWDGKDYNGRKASTGVYLVFSTGSQSFDTPDAFVTKIMIVD